MPIVTEFLSPSLTTEREHELTLTQLVIVSYVNRRQMSVLDFQERKVDLGRDTYDRRVHRPAASADERPHSSASARSSWESLFT
jgi:hypothetical protein